MLSTDGELEALRMLSNRYDKLSHRRVETVNRLHRLIAELVPGTRKRDLSAAQAKALIASVRPRDPAGKTRRRMAVEELGDRVRGDAQVKTITADLKATIHDAHGCQRACSLRVLLLVPDGQDTTGIATSGDSRSVVDLDCCWRQRGSRVRAISIRPHDGR